MDMLACAEGIVRVAEAEMLGALRLMTVERGIDPRGFALMPFGGAGPLHAAAMARRAGHRAHPLPARLGRALRARPRRRRSPPRRLAHGHAPRRLAHRRAPAPRERDALIAEACAALAVAPSRVRVRHELRYRGQSFELSVEESESVDPDVLREAFARAHELRYGYRDDSAEIELVNIRVSVWGPAPSSPAVQPLRPPPPLARAGEPRRDRLRRATRSRRSRSSAASLPPEPALRGPALCALPEATLLVPPGWSGTVDAYGTCHLERER